MTLFDDTTRTSTGFAEYAEPEFRYLNRSARRSVAAIRATMDNWFERFPDDGKADLRGRFRSDLNPHHASAFFELFLHELLLRLGCSVSPHPDVSGATTHPDFLVAYPTTGTFYLEAVLATGESRDEAANQARMNTVYDALNRMSSPLFFLNLSIRGAPESPPPARKLGNSVEQWLAQLDRDEITRLYDTRRFDDIPKLHFVYGGWTIDISPIPKSESLRGQPGVRPIGMRMHGFQWSNASGAIRDAIHSKAGRYGSLDLPYVIAVNTLEAGVDFEDHMDALFGKKQYMIDPNGPEPCVSEVTRVPDGAWTRPSGPRNSQISCVLLASQISPWNFTSGKIRLYHNPWASRKYTSALTILPQSVPDSDRMQPHCGKSPGDILDLPSEWPECLDRA